MQTDTGFINRCDNIHTFPKKHNDERGICQSLCEHTIFVGYPTISAPTAFDKVTGWLKCPRNRAPLKTHRKKIV